MNDLQLSEQLFEVVKSLRQSRRRMGKISERRLGGNHTQRAIEKMEADLNWEAMAITKLEYQAHAICVDMGIADPRSEAFYMPMEFNPSAFHKYTYTPPTPKVVKARIKVRAKA